MCSQLRRVICGSTRWLLTLMHLSLPISTQFSVHISHWNLRSSAPVSIYVYISLWTLVVLCVFLRLSLFFHYLCFFSFCSSLKLYVCVCACMSMGFYLFVSLCLVTHQVTNRSVYHEHSFTQSVIPSVELFVHQYSLYVWYQSLFFFSPLASALGHCRRKAQHCRWAERFVHSEKSSKLLFTGMYDDVWMCSCNELSVACSPPSPLAAKWKAGVGRTTTRHRYSFY